MTASDNSGDPATACDGSPHHWRKHAKQWRCAKCGEIDAAPIRSAQLLGRFYAGDKTPPPWARPADDTDDAPPD